MLLTLKGETMSAYKRQIRMTMTLGVLSILAGIFAHLALTDIYHGEGDLTLEWNVLRACALIIVMFIALALATLNKAMKTA